MYLASSPGGRDVVVKVVHSDLAGTPTTRQRFAREIEAARKIGGFHTAQIVDAGPDDDPPWMAAEYIPGRTLEELIRSEGPFPPEKVTALAAQLSEGLAAIHAHGVVHRDLKPANVVMADSGARIIDFGIARPVGGTALTEDGMVVGTYSFMSPEQLETGDVGPESDIFSLGSVLAFAATGDSPFEAPTIPGIAHRITAAPPNLGTLAGELRTLLTACLEKDPADRPSAADLLNRLADFPAEAGEAGADGAEGYTERFASALGGAAAGAAASAGPEEAGAPPDSAAEAPEQQNTTGPRDRSASTPAEPAAAPAAPDGGPAGPADRKTHPQAKRAWLLAAASLVLCLVAVAVLVWRAPWSAEPEPQSAAGAAETPSASARPEAGADSGSEQPPPSASASVEEEEESPEPSPSPSETPSPSEEAPASASTVESAQTGRCMDVKDAKADPQTPIIVHDCIDDAEWQQWDAPGDGTFRSMGFCLDIPNGAQEDGAQVQIATCNGSQAQQFQHRPDGTLVNLHSDKCVSYRGEGGNATPVVQATCAGAPGQKWNFS